MDHRVATVNITVPLSPKEETMAKAREVVKDIEPSFRNMKDDEIETKLIVGGITNVLLKVCGSNGKGFLVRAFGAKSEILIDRVKDNQAFQHLGSIGIGPKLHALFENGRVEEWKDMHALEPQEMGDANLSTLIARELYRFHQVNMPGEQKVESLWSKFDSWFGKALELTFENPEKQKIIDGLNLPQVKEQAYAIKDKLDALASPIVWSHNDLLSGNILRSPDSTSVLFIDFEYGSYNTRGFDVGNHFNEWAGFSCDWNDYPDEDKQKHFCREYLSCSGETVSDEAIDKLRNEANCYATMSHVFWMLWAVIQARFSTVDFDYFEYAQSRLAGFHFQMKKLGWE